MATTGDVKIEKLNRDNYAVWKFNMKMHLMGKDLWDLVQGVEVLAADATDAKREHFKRRTNLSLSMICLGVEADLQIYVRDCNSGKEAWDSLAAHFEEKTLSKKIMYRRKLYSIRLDSNTTMEAHVNKLKDISDHLQAVDDAVAEKDLVMILISSLSDDYNNLITALETLKEEQLTWTYVRDRVISEYLRRKSTAPPAKGKTSQDAFLTGNQHGARSAGGSGDNWKQNNNNKKNFKSQENKKSKMKCHECKEMGHLRRDCPKYLQKTEKANVATAEESGPTPVLQPTFSPEFALKVDEVDSADDDWWIDSAASMHMTSDIEDFLNFEQFDDPVKVNLADNSHLLATGSGQVGVRIFDINSSNKRTVDITLDDVLFVPEIQNKLFSIPSVTEKGGSVTLKKDSCVINKNGQSYQIGSKCGKLYKLNSVPIEQSCFVSSVAKQQSLSLWHLRFGHLNVNDVKLLHDQKLVNGMVLGSSDDIAGCHGCALGKSKRLPFPKKSIQKSSKPLELVHSDVCGPLHIESVGGSRYFVSFIDDYSRYVTVYAMKTKDEALDRFVDFALAAENKFGMRMKNFQFEGELGLKITKFRSDCGGEYVSKRFLEFCTSRGIENQLTTPYTPQQNGVSERMNRTLMEMARSMLYHADLPQELWAEAVSTAAYLRNRCPTSTFLGATPYERWFGSKPNVDHLRIFGCPVYVHTPDQKRRKLDPKAFKGLFVGYPAGTKGYKIFDPDTRKMVCSRDVSFLEDSFTSVYQHGLLSLQYSQPNHLNPDFDLFENDVSDAVHEHSDNSHSGSDQLILQFSDDEDYEIEEEHLASVIARPQRNRRAPDRLGEWATIANDSGDPRTFKQACKSSESVHWKEAMQKEYNSLKEYQTWDLVDLPPNANLIGCKWVFKTKRKADGQIDRFKARLVAQGFSQQHGVDYEETFAPVAKYKSIRTVLAIGNQLDLEIHQMDVNSAYLNGEIVENIYMKQPEGFVSPDYPNKVCKLRKSLYGLKQSARCWNDKIDSYLKSAGYKQNTADPCIYYRTETVNEKQIIVIMAVYVDDTVIMSNDIDVLQSQKVKISQRFSMDDRGEVHYILGMEVKRDRENRVMTICQKSYLESVIARFRMQNCNPVSTPLETGKRFTKLGEDEETVDIKLYQAAIGSLNYAAIATRPDLSVAVGMLSQHMVSPGNEHWSGVKRVLRYVKGTINYGLTFRSSDDFRLHGYSDADWAGCTETRKSTSGQVFRLGDCTISWRSRKQSIVALSSTESEYVALCETSQEVVWLRNLLRDIGFKQDKPTSTVVYEDNQGAIALSQNPKDHSRTKHIDIKFHYIREQISKGNVELQYCATADMLADTLTKGLPKPAFEKF